jgi:hypothetical protein
LDQLLARVNGGDERLEPILDPANGTTGGAGGESDRGLLGIEVELASEAAAHVRDDHPDLVLRNRQHCYR